MKTLNSFNKKKSGKSSRERQVLIGLVEYYIKTGKPVGSNTLKDAGFGNLSSATIRNYFAHLEKEGYLSQQHSSGGRIPTNSAFRLYAQEYFDANDCEPADKKELHSLREEETRELSSYLQHASERLSNLAQTAVFLSAPRFDQDYLLDIKLVGIDHQRCLCVMVTEFGVIQTEVLYLEQKLSAFSIKRIESYFHWRLTGIQKPENLTVQEEQAGQRFYNELIIRFIVGCSYGSQEDIYRTGFSKLLNHTEFHNPQTLAQSLGMFEDAHSMRLLLKECCKTNQLKVWIGEDLATYSKAPREVAVIAVPYHVNQKCVGAIGILGPVRIPYRRMLGLLKTFATNVSEALTHNIYKFKISFRQPESYENKQINDSHRLLEHSFPILLEDKSGD